MDLEGTEQTAAAKLEKTLAPQDLLHLLTDGYTLKILKATRNTPLSAQVLAKQCDIPSAVAYRRVKELVVAGLLKMAGGVGEENRYTQTYQSNVEVISIIYTPERGVSVNVQFMGRLAAERCISLEELTTRRTRLVLPASTDPPGSQ